MRHLSFSGVFPILKTPFNEKEEIVHDDVRKETEWLIANGVDGIGIALSSEIFKLSDIEKFDLRTHAVKKWMKKYENKKLHRIIIKLDAFNIDSNIKISSLIEFKIK